MFPVCALPVAVAQAKPLLLADITSVLPHVVFTVLRVDESAETHFLFDGIYDSRAQVSTFKLSPVMAYCKAHPQHGKTIVDCKGVTYSSLPLAGAVGDSHRQRTPCFFSWVGHLSYKKVVLDKDSKFHDTFKQSCQLLRALCCPHIQLDCPSNRHWGAAGTS